MTSLLVAGNFPWYPGIDNPIASTAHMRMAINLNGIPSWRRAALSPESGIIMVCENPTSGANLAIYNRDTSGVIPEVQSIGIANDGMYERRKIAWVKVVCRPRYRNFVNLQTVATPALGEQRPSPLLTVSDNYGVNLNVNFIGLTFAYLQTQYSGLKYSDITRFYKIFRRGLSVPLSPKYILSSQVNAHSSAHSNPAGQWQESTLTSSYTTSGIQNSHVVTFSDEIPYAEYDKPMYDVFFKIKYVWYDRKTSVVA